MLAENDASVDIVLRDSNANETNTNAQSTKDDSVQGITIHNYVLPGAFFEENFQDDIDRELNLTVNKGDYRVDLGKIHIDNIAPTCEFPEHFTSNRWYYGAEDRNITIANIDEQIDASLSKVYSNGSEIPFTYSDVDNSVTFTLSQGWHNVGVSLVDMAGNTNNIQERINIHVGYFWLWIIIAAVVVVAGLLTFILVRIKIKKRQLGE